MRLVGKENYMKNKRIILASNSPRRRQLLGGLGLAFEVKVLKGVDESYPSGIPATQVAEYIAAEKASAYDVGDDELLITADTIVVVGNQILGKPKDAAEAVRMLRLISGCTHQVVTGVCMLTQEKQRRFSVCTDVTFRKLSDTEIDYYVSRYKPYDKAGAYGIQEWIGFVGVTAINGSYYNVMGLPVQRVYDELVNVYGIDLAACE